MLSTKRDVPAENGVKADASRVSSFCVVHLSGIKSFAFLKTRSSEIMLEDAKPQDGNAGSHTSVKCVTWNLHDTVARDKCFANL
jgi:hypothetical protein